MIRLSKSGYGVKFNQLAYIRNSQIGSSVAGVTCTRLSDGGYRFTGTGTGTTIFTWNEQDNVKPIPTHKYYIKIIVTDYESDSVLGTLVANGFGSLGNGTDAIYTAGGNAGQTFYTYWGNGQRSDQTMYVMQTDLTVMFGSGYEPTTVAQFKEMYNNPRFDYTTGQWQWSKKGYETAFPTPVIENGTTLLPIENHIVGILSYDSGNIKSKYNYSTRELPVGFVRLDYIESSGTQWIDTGVIPSLTQKYIIDGQFTDVGSSQHNGATNGGYYFLPLSIWSGYNYFGCQSGSSAIFSSVSKDLNKHIFVFDLLNGKFIVDTVEQSFTPSSNISQVSEIAFYLFRLNGINSGYDYLRLYSCKIYDNGTLVRNYIPCYRYSDGVEGLYDTVNNRFDTNQGTGRFIRGKEIESGNLLELKNFVRGYPSDTNWSNSTKRTFTENTYVEGLTSNNYYGSNNVSSVSVNADNNSISFTCTSTGYGIGCAKRLTVGKTYKLYYVANNTNYAVPCSFYDIEGNYLGYSYTDTLQFTVPQNAYYSMIIFRTGTTAGSITYSNISLHEVY